MKEMTEMDETAMFPFCVMRSARLAWRACQRKCDPMATFARCSEYFAYIALYNS